MVKRINVFEDEDGSAGSSEEEEVKRIVKKPKKVPPEFLEKCGQSGQDHPEAPLLGVGLGGFEPLKGIQRTKELPEYPDEEPQEYMKFTVPEVLEESSHKEETVDQEHSLNIPLYERKVPSIGLAMMEKMGFRIGDSLGVPKDKPMNQVPLEVIVKNDRKGIGSSTEISSATTKEFISRNASKSKEGKLLRTVHNLMKLCFELSGESDKWHEDNRTDEVTYLWRDIPIQLENKQALLLSKKRRYDDNFKDILSIKENKELQNFDTEDKLTLLLLYLREAHFYCYFCGCKYHDAKELNESCPGVFEESHIAV
ncbi:uncharacterized protein CANTADRAFT_5820 [Suhomyces tanzawaensis NRRL Y-17324]|uniref:G-patch domain-containing protein n=1 Tax=Suhomyces tanzawaensis NRRL Y-17324 TaxID=984487 RepID=A0A1E4SL45_9ASCO|nr:uncharacterized protein CANTADRAFT_5820 [Suhomyces tanzawaensis NRRL Y-17324]ODV80152.1 hypothetical protein CANTADRAFT_5820 [Suhomyces tanzawaensis NRRL Y-17324]